MSSMAEDNEVALDRAQVKKAVQALLAFLKTKSTGETRLLDDAEHISLLFTFLRIPKKAQTIRIPLPHGQRTDTEEVCLFTKDEPNMTPEQTQRFYKRLLEEKGVKNITEIIPYKLLKTEYKPYEAKRRLLGNFDMFLSDDRIRRFLPSHIGKHFYLRKREPLCVNLQSKNLARDIQRLVQGTNLKVNNKGSCCMARVGHSDMTADELTDNIEAAVKTVAEKIHAKGPVMKVIHVKSQASVALPIYTCNMSHLEMLAAADNKSETPKKVGVALKKLTKKNKRDGSKGGSIEQTDPSGEKEEEQEEEIPQLVPIETPSKKPKLEKPAKKKKQLENVSKPAKDKKEKKGKKAANKVIKKSGKTGSKVKRKVLKVK